MKKSIMMLATAMMGAAAGMTDPFATRGGIPRPEPKIAKENRKKCKTCKKFHKGERYCDIGHCVGPNDVACGHHERRKRK